MIKYLLILLLILSSQIKADSIISLAIEQGYNSNLFNDSLEYDDSYTTLISDILLYPAEIVEIDMYGDIYKYAKTNDLSNFNGGVSITVIPTEVFMRSQIYLNGSISFLKYGNDFSIYDNRTISANSSWNYQLTQKITTKIGGGASSVTYTSTSSAEDRMIYAFAGFNATVLKNNSFDFETAYYNKKFLTDDSFNSDNSYIDLLGRYSRPLSNSLGLKISYLKRILQDDDNAYMPGFTVDYLSPWASLWGGDEVNVTIKKIFTHAVVVSLQYTYNKKEYINQLDLDSLIQPIYTIFTRKDNTNSFYLHLEKELSLSDKILIPRISFYNQNNNSSNELYTYNKFSIFASLGVSF